MAIYTNAQAPKIIETRREQFNRIKNQLKTISIHRKQIENKLKTSCLNIKRIITHQIELCTIFPEPSLENLILIELRSLRHIFCIPLEFVCV